MELEYGLVENALDSLREAMNYYNEGDEEDNANQYKFSILLSAHCVELLLKEILRRSHPALLFENIDTISDLQNDDNQTVGYKVAITRVKKLCGIDLQQYEGYIEELGRVRNQIQHYKCSINGEYHKELMAKTFSAIEFIFRDILELNFEDFTNIIDATDIEILHEDIKANTARKKDIRKEFSKNKNKFRIEYLAGKYIDVCCPHCGTESLALENNGKIKCKFCGNIYDDYSKLHEADKNCLTQYAMLRNLGRRKHLLYSKIYECPCCENESIIKLANQKWMCLVCGNESEESWYCDECGDEIPNMQGICATAISDTDTEDYKTLCPKCAKKYAEDEEYIGYELNW